MSMLGKNWRVRVSNTQNQAITCIVKAIYWKFDSNGALVFSTEQIPLASTLVLATTGSAVGTNIDNNTDKYLGMDLTVYLTASLATNGTGSVAVYLERSTDTAVTWPSQDLGRWVGGYLVTTANGTTEMRTNITVR